MTYKGAKKPLPQIAQELGVDAVVEGSVASASGRIRIVARLIRAAGEVTVWTNTYEGALRDTFGLQTEMAGALTREMRAAVTPTESARLGRSRTVDPEAYDLYLRGRYQVARWESDGYAAATVSLEKAIAKDPNFADAHALLASALLEQAILTLTDPRPTMAKARAEAQKALTLDDSLGEAHVAQGLILGAFDYDLKGQERELRRAIELSPSDSRPHVWLAQVLSISNPKEGVEAAARALALDPVTPNVNLMLGWSLYYADRYDESLAQLRKVLELDSRTYFAHAEIAWNLAALGRHAEAVQSVARAYEAKKPGDDPVLDLSSARVLADAGKRREALALLEPWEARFLKEYVDAIYFVAPRAALGDREAAIRWLEEAWRQRSASLPYLRQDLGRLSIRDDPRVAEILRRPPAPL